MRTSNPVDCGISDSETPTESSALVDVDAPYLALSPCVELDWSAFSLAAGPTTNVLLPDGSKPVASSASAFCLIASSVFRASWSPSAVLTSKSDKIA
jgi:hypothetical protein